MSEFSDNLVTLITQEQGFVLFVIDTIVVSTRRLRGSTEGCQYFLINGFMV